MLNVCSAMDAGETPPNLKERKQMLGWRREDPLREALASWQAQAEAQRATANAADCADVISAIAALRKDSWWKINAAGIFTVVVTALIGYLTIYINELGQQATLELEAQKQRGEHLKERADARREDLKVINGQRIAATDFIEKHPELTGSDDAAFAKAYTRLQFLVGDELSKEFAIKFGPTAKSAKRAATIIRLAPMAVKPTILEAATNAGKIYCQAASTVNLKVRGEISSALQKDGFDVPGWEIKDSSQIPKESQVRYFRTKDAEQAAKAAEIVEQVTGLPKGSIKTRQLKSADTPAGTIELWFVNPSPS